MSQNATQVKTQSTTGNTSGQGWLQGEVPEEIKEWSWGGFLLNWVWGIGNKVWISLIGLAPFPVSLIVSILLGLKGNEWAWQCKKWDSIEQFRHRQRVWMWWGIVGAVIAPFFFVLGWILIIVGLLGYYHYI